MTFFFNPSFMDFGSCCGFDGWFRIMGGAHYAEPPIKATTGPHFVALACGFDGSALMPHSSGA